MALSNEDYKDVKGAMGKAMANKISKVTRDRKPVDASNPKALKKWLATDKTSAKPRMHDAAVIHTRGIDSDRTRSVKEWEKSSESFKKAARKLAERQVRERYG